jgi:hypothetical protein
MNSDNQYTRELLEGEDYYEKQFEDYLRLNPIEEMDALAENYDEEKGQFEKEQEEEFEEEELEEYFEEEEEQTSVVDEEEEQVEVDCDRCVSKILYNDSVIYNQKRLCEGCVYDCIQDLLAPYSEEQRQEIYKYTEEHNLTIEEAIDYQTHCHCCGNHVENAIIDSENHQYCKKICFNHCEDYWYDCFRGEECKVCEIWAYRTRRDSLTAYDIHLSECEPVLATIDAFKELKVHGQIYECLGDLAEYFGDLAFYGDDVNLYY